MFYPCNLKKIDQQKIWENQRNYTLSYDGFALYIHVPFCYSICNYCPFSRYKWSHSAEKTYINSIKKEMALYSELPFIENSKILTIHIGGGTPTSLSVSSLNELMDSIKENFNVAKNIQIAIEASPLIDIEKLSKMREMGINRISFGVQSFQDGFLEILGTSHRSRHATNCVKWARDVGFENVSIDLLYRLPGQNIDHWEEDLEYAINIEPDHLSLYSLILCDRTPLIEFVKSGKIKDLPGVEADIEFDRWAYQKLRGYGYERITLNDYSLNGKKSIYAEICWKAPQGEYLGLGPGAFEYINDYYTCKVNNLRDYVDNITKKATIPYKFGTFVSEYERMHRFFVFGFKYLAVNLNKFEQEFGISADSIFEETIKRLIRYKLIEERDSKLVLTDKGILYSNTVMKAFFSPEQLQLYDYENSFKFQIINRAGEFSQFYLNTQKKMSNHHESKIIQRR